MTLPTSTLICGDVIAKLKEPVMQDTTDIHGQTMREFYEQDEAEAKAKKALADARVRQIRIVPRIGRNDLCPCGSGLKFKRCCIAKVGKGPEMIR